LIWQCLPQVVLQVVDVITHEQFERRRLREADGAYHLAVDVARRGDVIGEASLKGSSYIG